MPLSSHQSPGMQSIRSADVLPTSRQHPEPDNLYHGEAVDAFDNLATFFDANCALQVFSPASSARICPASRTMFSHAKARTQVHFPRYPPPQVPRALSKLSKASALALPRSRDTQLSPSHRLYSKGLCLACQPRATQKKLLSCCRTCREMPGRRRRCTRACPRSRRAPRATRSSFGEEELASGISLPQSPRKPTGRAAKLTLGKPWVAAKAHSSLPLPPPPPSLPPPRVIITREILLHPPPAFAGKPRAIPSTCTLVCRSLIMFLARFGSISSDKTHYFTTCNPRSVDGEDSAGIDDDSSGQDIKQQLLCTFIEMASCAQGQVGTEFLEQVGKLLATQQVRPKHPRVLTPNVHDSDAVAPLCSLWFWLRSVPSGFPSFCRG